MENPTPSVPRPRPALRLPVSLRTRLILATILIVAASIAALGLYVYYRGQQSSAYLTNELRTNLRQKAVDTLTTSTQANADTLNTLFGTVSQQITNVGVSVNSMLMRQELLGSGAYWNAPDELIRLQNGSWDNSDWTQPASVFIPAKQDLNPRLIVELNTLKQLDFTVPNILKTNTDIVAIYFGGPSGETLYYPNIDLANIVPPDFDVTSRPWYIAASTKNNPRHVAVWSAPYLDAALHGLVITSSYPVYDNYQGFRGVVAMDVQLTRMAVLVSGIRVGKTGYAFVIDGDGRLIAMPDHGYQDLGYTADVMPLGDVIEQDKLPAPLPADLNDVIERMKLGQTGLQTITFNGEERYIAYRPIPEAGQSLAIIVPTSEMLAGAAEAERQIAESSASTQVISFVLVLVILGLAVAATWRIGNTLIGPLISLTGTAQQITQGDLDARALVKGHDEISTLAAALNTMTGRLRDSIVSLERRVKDRTAALEAASSTAGRRAAQFEAITQVTRAISSIRNMDELMPLVASVISQYFGFYHVGIFLNDEHQENTWLIAANSEGGHHMLQRHHNLKIGAQGIVGYVASQGESRVARSVGEDAVFFNNPDLPETKSEAALPLRRGGEVAGVLDVQSTKEDAFTSEDLSILAILADQVSLAMENTRLFETTRRSLMEAETLYRQYVQEAWTRLPQEGQVTGYRYTPRGTAPIATPQEAAAAEAAARSQASGETAPIVVPIKLRGETIGNLIVQAQRPGGWSQDQVELAQAVAERVALSAENARLFDETSRRAERERLVTEITSRIRSTNDPEEMIRTAVDELRNALGASEIQVIPQVISAASTQGEPMPAAEVLQRGNGANQ
jgi:GAF domain-containing protein